MSSSQSTHPTYVALAGFAMHGVDAEILKGIQYNAHREGWQLFNAADPLAFEQVEQNQNFFKGIIAVVTDDDFCQRLRKLRIPVVNVSDTYPETFGFPTVLTDNEKIGVRAAEDFIARDYQHFAVHFLPGVHSYRFLNTRSRAFGKFLQSKGFSCVGLADFYSEKEKAFIRKAQMAVVPLRDLSLPCAVFCGSDRIAANVCVATRALGFRVPEDLAVVGVDNFELYCNMVDPPLSSIDTRGENIGQKAVEVLRDLLSGKRANQYFEEIVPPGRVVSRRSVDFGHRGDNSVFRAQKFIQDHCGERINVGDIVQASQCSRRKIENDYRARYGCSLLDALNQARINRARQLAKETSLLVIDIARTSGFRDTQQMYRVLARYGKRLR
ncbi:MAG: substrate-binding domain-containing protein [Opitutales bacterium]|nr:substrate-binding domain-containing protein [Opitutales bacterium]